jgi:hypothetical protein
MNIVRKGRILKFFDSTSNSSGSNGVVKFIDLDDTPASYSEGYIKVNQNGDGLEFVAINTMKSDLEIPNEIKDLITLSQNDAGKFLQVNQAGDNFELVEITSDIPDYSNAQGKILSVDSNGNLVWIDIPTELPTYGSNENDKILGVVNGSLAWVDKPQGVTTFVDLNDTPNSLVANKYIKVNSDGTSLELVDEPQGVSTFKELTDTPNDYANNAGKVVVVKQDESGLEFVANQSGGSTTFKELTDTPNDYTNEKGKLVVVKQDEDGVEFIEMPESCGVIYQNTPVKEVISNAVTKQDVQTLVEQAIQTFQSTKLSGYRYVTINPDYHFPINRGIIEDTKRVSDTYVMKWDLTENIGLSLKKTDLGGTELYLLGYYDRINDTFTYFKKDGNYLGFDSENKYGSMVKDRLLFAVDGKPILYDSNGSDVTANDAEYNDISYPIFELDASYNVTNVYSFNADGYMIDVNACGNMWIRSDGDTKYSGSTSVVTISEFTDMSGSTPNDTDITLNRIYQALTNIRHDISTLYGMVQNDNDDTKVDVYRIKLDLANKTLVSETLIFTFKSNDTSANIAEIEASDVSLDENMFLYYNNTEPSINALIKQEDGTYKKTVLKNGFTNSYSNYPRFNINNNEASFHCQYSSESKSYEHIIKFKISPKLLCMVDRTYQQDDTIDISGLVGSSIKGFDYASNIGSNNSGLDIVVLDDDGTDVILKAVSVGDNEIKWQHTYNRDRKCKVVSIGGYTIVTDSYSLHIRDNADGTLVKDVDLSGINYDTDYGIRALNLYFSGTSLDGYGFSYYNAGDTIFKKYDMNSNEVASITVDEPYGFFTDKASQAIYALDTIVDTTGDPVTEVRIRKYALDGTFIAQSKKMTFDGESDGRFVMAYGSVLGLNVQFGAQTPKNRAICIEDIDNIRSVASFDGEINNNLSIKTKDDFYSWASILSNTNLKLMSFV